MFNWQNARKKTVSLALILMSVLFLFACGDKTSSTSSDENGEHHDITEGLLSKEDMHDLAERYMRDGELDKALDLYNQVKKDYDVSKEIELCEKYAEYVGYWESNNFTTSTSEKTWDQNILLFIPIDPDTGDVVLVGYSVSQDGYYKYRGMNPDFYKLTVSDMQATGEAQKHETVFDLSTGHLHSDYKGDTNGIHGYDYDMHKIDGDAIKNADKQSVILCNGLMINAPDSSVDGILYGDGVDEPGKEHYYYSISNYWKGLATMRFNAYAADLEKYADVYGYKVEQLGDHCSLYDENGDEVVTMEVIEDMIGYTLKIKSVKYEY